MLLAYEWITYQLVSKFQTRGRRDTPAAEYCTGLHLDGFTFAHPTSSLAVLRPMPIRDRHPSRVDPLQTSHAMDSVAETGHSAVGRVDGLFHGIDALRHDSYQKCRPSIYMFWPGVSKPNVLRWQIGVQVLLEFCEI